MPYFAERRSSTRTDIMHCDENHEFPRMIGFVKCLVRNHSYRAEAGLRDLGIFGTPKAAEAAIIHEFTHPLPRAEIEAGKA